MSRRSRDLHPPPRWRGREGEGRRDPPKAPCRRCIFMRFGLTREEQISKKKCRFGAILSQAVGWVFGCCLTNKKKEKADKE